MPKNQAQALKTQRLSHQSETQFVESNLKNAFIVGLDSKKSGLLKNCLWDLVSAWIFFGLDSFVNDFIIEP